jgi:hypothetical protein
MTHVSSRDELHAITDQLLFSEDNTKLTRAARQLYHLFLKIAGSLDSDHDSQLPDGRALSASEAAQCVLDVARTAKFLRGVFAAVSKAQQQFPGKRIEVVYAGCGPFAPLIIPIAKRFDPAIVRITLIDIHQESLDSVQRLVEVFGIQEHIRSFQQEDASSYTHDLPIDILIVETMQRALVAEPQVAVTLNLTKQLRREGILIPEEIAVDLAAVNLEKEFTDLDTTKVRIDLGVVFQLTRDSSLAIDRDGSFLACVKNVGPLEKHLTLCLFTRIRIFDTIELGYYESGITFIHPLHDLSLSENSNRLEFTYRLGPKPGFAYRWI